MLLEDAEQWYTDNRIHRGMMNWSVQDQESTIREYTKEGKWHGNIVRHFEYGLEQPQKEHLRRIWMKVLKASVIGEHKTNVMAGLQAEKGQGIHMDYLVEYIKAKVVNAEDNRVPFTVVNVFKGNTRNIHEVLKLEDKLWKTSNYGSLEGHEYSICRSRNYSEGVQDRESATICSCRICRHEYWKRGIIFGNLQIKSKHIEKCYWCWKWVTDTYIAIDWQQYEYPQEEKCRIWDIFENDSVTPPSFSAFGPQIDPDRISISNQSRLYRPTVEEVEKINVKKGLCVKCATLRWKHKEQPPWRPNKLDRTKKMINWLTHKKRLPEQIMTMLLTFLDTDMEP